MCSRVPGSCRHPKQTYQGRGLLGGLPHVPHRVTHTEFPQGVHIYKDFWGWKGRFEKNCLKLKWVLFFLKYLLLQVCHLLLLILSSFKVKRKNGPWCSGHCNSFNIFAYFSAFILQSESNRIKENIHERGRESENPKWLRNVFPLFQSTVRDWGTFYQGRTHHKLLRAGPP